MHNYRYISFSYLNNLNVSFNICNFISCNEGWVESKKRKTHSIWIVTKGKMKIAYKGKDYILSGKDLFVFSEGIEYTATALCDDTQFLFLNFTLYNDIRKIERIVNIGIEGKIEYNDMKVEIDLIIKKAAYYIPIKRGLYYAPFFNGMILVVLTTVYELIYKDYLFDNNKELTLETPKINNVIDYIYEHKGEKLTTKHLAKTFDVSEKTLYNQFKKARGVTPHGFVWQVKMKYAVELIHTKKYSIKEIAAMVGYDDPKTFASVFKRWIGVSPSKFNK